MGERSSLLFLQNVSVNLFEYISTCGLMYRKIETLDSFYSVYTKYKNIVAQCTDMFLLIIDYKICVSFFDVTYDIHDIHSKLLLNRTILYCIQGFIMPMCTYFISTSYNTVDYTRVVLYLDGYG